MNFAVTESLNEVVAQLRVLFPDWRLGQLIANLVMAAGGADSDAIWDMDDELLLLAARRFIQGNSRRC